MKLRFEGSELTALSNRYAPSSGELLLVSMTNAIKTNGHISSDQLFAIARWKSPRSAGMVKNNTELFIREITSISLNAKDERTRIETLTLLDGVSWPTASVILHFFHNDSYPILDIRSLWSLKTPKPATYDFSFWQDFVSFNRNLASKNRIDMRHLDKALWQYSFENE